MYNIKTAVSGNILTITVDLSTGGHMSASGKSTVIASTEGNQTVKDDIKMGVNIYKPRS